MSSTQTAVIVILIIAIAVGAVFVWMALRRYRLRQRFGPEYDKMLAEQQDHRAVERELRDRERRHADLNLRPLEPAARQRYAGEWARIQAHFVEAPADAVGEAHRLVTELVAERGYPTDDHDEELAQLSVDHARTVGHYRDAHEIHQRNERGEATTEMLRQAVVHYRALVADLLGEDPVRPDNPSTTAHEAQAPQNTKAHDNQAPHDATRR